MTSLPDLLQEAVPGEVEPLDHEALQSRAARRRTTGRALTAVVGVAAVGALAVGALAGWQGQAPWNLAIDSAGDGAGANEPSRAVLELVGPEAAASEAADLLPVVSPFQRDILADGVVSQTEIDRSVDAVLTCTRDQGVSAGVTVSPSGRNFSWGATGSPVDKLGDVLDECTHQFHDAVASVWMTQETPVDPRQHQQDRESLRACLAEADAPVEGELTWDTVSVAIHGENNTGDNAAAEDCLDLYGYVLELPR